MFKVTDYESKIWYCLDELDEQNDIINILAVKKRSLLNLKIKFITKPRLTEYCINTPALNDVVFQTYYRSQIPKITRGFDL